MLSDQDACFRWWAMKLEELLRALVSQPHRLHVTATGTLLVIVCDRSDLSTVVGRRHELQNGILKMTHAFAWRERLPFPTICYKTTEASARPPG